jgi:hypothetical protein
VVDHLPVATPERPRPHLRTLNLLVGRVTTIKLTYWAALTVYELWGPRSGSIAVVVATTLGALAWSVVAARQVDRRAGGIGRSIATVAVTFVTASVVAAPASLPLLLVERQHSIDGCVAQQSCHGETLVLWAAVFVIGFLLIPAVFALALRRGAPE